MDDVSKNSADILISQLKENISDINISQIDTANFSNLTDDEKIELLEDIKNQATELKDIIESINNNLNQK